MLGYVANGLTVSKSTQQLQLICENSSVIPHGCGGSGSARPKIAVKMGLTTVLWPSMYIAPSTSRADSTSTDFSETILSGSSNQYHNFATKCFGIKRRVTCNCFVKCYCNVSSNMFLDDEIAKQHHGPRLTRKGTRI